jgi:TonB family protein
MAGFPKELSEPLIVRPDSSLPQFRNIPGLASSLLSPPPAKNNTHPSREEAGSGLSRQDLPLRNHPPMNLKITPGLADSKIPVSNQPAPTHQQASAPSSLLQVQQRPFTPPVVLYRRYPILRRGMLFSNAVVPVIVRLNESGEITSVALADSNSNVRPEISKDALAAARKWRFAAAKVGDKAVTSEIRINFVFRPSQSTDGVAP